MWPIIKPTPVQYQDDEYLKLLVSDFRGGVNITDPALMLPANQFTMLQDFQYSREGILESRPPFRPEYFSDTLADKPVQCGQAVESFATQNEQWTFTFPTGISAGTFDITINATTASGINFHEK
jgi:hypothetical protein